jgi:hypothetical protein
VIRGNRRLTVREVVDEVGITLKRRRFQTIEAIRERAISELLAITESAFKETFKQWKKRWERCIASRGDYFQGDGTYNAVK